MTALTKETIQAAVRLALAEDVGTGDLTSALLPATHCARAKIVAREPLTLAGVDVAIETLHAVDPAIIIKSNQNDGDSIGIGSCVIEAEGPTHSLLTAERVALNFLQHLSGIATLTTSFVKAINGTRTRILDTRKTTPGLRALEKYAVTCGGGTNHRSGLYDQILIKDNHIAALATHSADAITEAIHLARTIAPGKTIEIEVDNLEQLDKALAAGADIILLDNMSPAEIREAVRLTGGRALLEASGGINLTTIRAYAETGVDFISVGALTHSARAVDLSMELDAL